MKGSLQGNQIKWKALDQVWQEINRVNRFAEKPELIRVILTAHDARVVVRNVNECYIVHSVGAVIVPLEEV
jgi:hypothetical protein